MVDGLHIPIWNRTEKPLTIVSNRVGRGLMGRNNGSNVNNVQCKTDWNCHYESPSLYGDYILIK
jgi:hypothetical protein